MLCWGQERSAAACPDPSPGCGTKRRKQENCHHQRLTDDRKRSEKWQKMRERIKLSNCFGAMVYKYDKDIQFIFNYYLVYESMTTT